MRNIIKENIEMYITAKFDSEFQKKCAHEELQRMLYAWVNHVSSKHKRNNVSITFSDNNLTVI